MDKSKFGRLVVKIVGFTGGSFDANGIRKRIREIVKEKISPVVPIPLLANNVLRQVEITVVDSGNTTVVGQVSRPYLEIHYTDIRVKEAGLILEGIKSLKLGLSVTKFRICHGDYISAEEMR